MERIEEIPIPEKITCAAAGREAVFGGFLGTVYLLTSEGLVKQGKEKDPISFLQKEESSAYIKGLWSGFASFGDKSVNLCAPLPCKYIALLNEEYILASDTKSIYLRDAEGNLVGDKKNISTYLIKAFFVNGKAVCFTGYEVYWMCIAAQGLRKDSVVDIHKKMGETETITALDESGGAIVAGTIGGWVTIIERWEEPEDLAVEKIVKIGSEKIMDILWYNDKKEHAVGITPNKAFIVDIKRKKSIASITLSSSNSLLAIRECSWKKGLFSVGDINFAIHIIGTEKAVKEKSAGASLQVENESTSPAQRSTDQIYKDLLAEIESGLV